MKKQTLFWIAVALLGFAAGVAAMKKRQSLTAPARLKSGKLYSVDSAYDQAGY